MAIRSLSPAPCLLEQVKEEDPVVIGDAVLHGKHVVGADELRHDQTLRCTAKGTVRKVLPNVDVGETLLPDLGVAIIAFPIVRPPGLVERPQKYDFFVVTERTYRFNLFQVHPGEHVVMGQALFDGKPVIGEELGESVSIKANSSGHVEMVLETLHPNYFVLKDVAVMLIRPKVLWPPGIQAESPQDHILTTDRVLVFLEWKAHIDDEVSPGDPLMLAQDWGSGKPHVLHASVKGLLSHPRFMEKGQIIEMGVGVARITVEVTTTSYNASAAQIQGSEDSFNPFLWLSIGAGVVIGLMLAAVVFFYPKVLRRLCILITGPPPRPPPEVVSVSTSETVTVQHEGFRHDPTNQHYEHHHIIHHHHHGGHHHQGGGQ
ncbi:unnamed protein product [Durusdinium trenchii]|uniref:Uncharacterized protein n=1 Tax=Durusdinium trenchii TaxID=1381693 RepID=A0ABP0JJV0_9DINO